MADKDNPEELDDEIQPKKSPLVLILIIVNVLVIAGGATAFFLMGSGGGGDSGGDNNENASAEESEEEEEPSINDEPGPLVQLPPFVVNLSDTERSHYLKVAVSIELRDEAAKVRYEPRKTHARHAVLMTLSSLSFDETRDIDDRERIRERLHNELEKVVGPRMVRAVLFTDFVTQ